MEEMFRDGLHLLSEHNMELRADDGMGRFKPNEAAYHWVEKMGCLLLLGVWQKQRMVGYTVTIISADLHDADLVIAHCNLIFITKTMRKGALGIKLMRETEQKAKARGAHEIIWQAKVNTTFSRLLAEMRDTQLHGVIYKKEL